MPPEGGSPDQPPPPIRDPPTHLRGASTTYTTIPDSPIQGAGIPVRFPGLPSREVPNNILTH